MEIEFTGGEEFAKKLKEMLKGQKIGLRIGFFEGATYPDGTSVANVAALNEYGHLSPVGRKGQAGPQMRVPPRPFFSRMLAAKSPLWANRVVNLNKRYAGDMHQVFRALGLSIAQDLQQAIVDFNDPADKDSTIESKGFKGGAQATLQDTKVMLNSVAYEVDGERMTP